ncbi:MAG TPA: amidinotransferase [Thermoanaerobaculia bacterium]|jgi:glycine amidinotransferase|nr:amidinotransferase [Thermoanaerobaculia bacterium]
MSPPPVQPATPRVVSSHNEWDPLEEVIVGIVDDAVLPAWDVINVATVPPGEWETVVKTLVGQKGSPYPPHLVEAARKEIEDFVHVLESEGITVRRPERMDFRKPFSTPDWEMASGFCAANPRDVMLVIGDEIIEAPMADRGRHYETWPYRKLLKEYFRGGAKWTSAPKPQLLDDQYDADYRVPAEGEPIKYVVTEFEPTFDAADFIRCGRDLFTQKSNVTNDFGIQWLQRHLGDGYRIHVLESRDPCAIHIDSTFLPMAPGKVMVNPKYLDVTKLPDVVKKWDVLIPPEPDYTPSEKLGLLSPWISLNVLMLDEERVIIEKTQRRLEKTLKDWGFKPIPLAFTNYYALVGSFHCATLDVRRSGELKSYF